MSGFRLVVRLLVVVGLFGAVLAAPASASRDVMSDAVVASASSGYWLVDESGLVYGFGDATDFGVSALPAGRTAVDIEASPTGAGLWVLDSGGEFYPYGGADALAALDMSVLDELVDFANAPDVPERVVSMVPTATGGGMYVFTNKGRVITRGDAVSEGDMSGWQLSSPVLDAKLDPDGSGYWMLAADGGVFSFDADFHGSIPQLVPAGLTAEEWLNEPVVGMTPDPTSGGYWLVAADGGVFSFGGAEFRGSMGGIPLNKPVVGMVSYGNGYLLVAEDGGVFNFSDRPFEGSLGDNPPTTPVVTITPTTDALGMPKLSKISGNIIQPGMSLSVAGAGFQPNTTVQIELHSDPKVLGTTQTSATGQFNQDVTIPADTELGNHEIVAVGFDRNGESVSDRQRVKIGIDTDDPALLDVSVGSSSVDITNGSATFTVDVSASDAGVGVFAGGATFVGCGGDISTFWNDRGDSYPVGNVISGDRNNGIWRHTVTVPAGIPSCTLTLFVVDLCDSVDNCVVFRDSQIPSLQIEVTRQN